MAYVRRWLRLADTPVLVQQIDLVAGNMRGGAWGTALLVLLVRAVWLNDGNVTAMNVWCVVIGLVQLNIQLFIRRYDRLAAAPIPRKTAANMVWRLAGNSLIGGAAWGSLVWMAPASVTVAQSSLILSVMAAVLCGAVSVVSPLLPVLLAFMVSAVGVMVLKADAGSTVGSVPVALGCALYIAILLDQGRKGAAAAEASIRLRFENAALLEQLKGESEALISARLDAERASAAKSKVLAAASHDLRQPVHAQGLFLDVLARTELTPQQRELLGYANASVAASANMLGTLFDFSRIEAGVIEPQRQAFAVQPLLNKIEREFAPQADIKGLGYRSRESRLVVHSDPALVELILRNLVSNAIRYTQRGGLLVACRAQSGHAVLEVWDTGIGIAKSHQREVFREFHQLANPERDRRKGFGLGLAIVEGLSSTLGHALSVSSEPQRGSVFRLTLPVAGEAAVAEPVESRRLEPHLPDIRILVIDDDEAIQSSMLQLLASWGCRCDVAGSVEQAIELARRRPPDLVLSDYQLGGKRSGLDAVAELRTLVGSTVPALLVTADTARERVDEAAALGITVLHKPVSPAQLSRALAALLPR